MNKFSFSSNFDSQQEEVITKDQKTVFQVFFFNLTYLSGVTTLMPTKLISYQHLFNEDFLQYDETFVNKIESSNFTYTANGKRQIQVENF